MRSPWGAIDNTALRVDDATTLVAFDHLGDQDMAPGTQSGPPARARAHGIAKGLANRPDGRAQPIGTKPPWTVRRAAEGPLNQPPEQGQVALLADFPTQPQPGPHQHGQGHPDDPA